MRGGGTSAAQARAAEARRAPAPSPRRAYQTALRAVWAVAMFTFLWFTWQGLERQITWYLAVDQFGYLTFAHDLLAGKVFHHWRPLDSLHLFMPLRTDVLAQTYVRDGDVLYCRYSPGFPMLLASWIAAFGDEGAHYLNPTVYMTLLALALLFQWRAFRSPWRAGAGTVLIALFPTLMYLWGLTLTRDLAAHLAAFAGLFVLLPARGHALGWRRTAVAGLALGFAICIRPDGVIYLLAATLMAAVRWGHEGVAWRRLGASLAAGSLAVLVGASPFLAFNWAATGNPLLPTQGMELSILPPPKPAAPPPAAAPAQPETGAKIGYPPGWHGGAHVLVQGGGLKLENLRTTLPGNWALLVRAYSPPMLVAAGVGIAVAVVLRPVFAAGAVGYIVLAFLFYSCWPRADGRYLAGIFLLLPMLIVEGTLGTLDVVRLLARRRQPAWSRRLALTMGTLAIAGAIAGASQPEGNVLAWILPITCGVTGLAAFAAAMQPRRRVAGIAAIVMMLCLVGLSIARVQEAAGRHAPFQREAMHQARANMQRLLEPGSVVITSEDVGRPAENIEFYSGVANALYLTDLRRWQMTPHGAAAALLFGGQRPYLYIPYAQRDKQLMLENMAASGIEARRIADIPAQASMAHFVAAPFHHGMRMELYRLASPLFEEAGRASRAGRSAGAPAPPGSTP